MRRTDLLFDKPRTIRDLERSRKNLVCKIGFNDADYVISAKYRGARVQCPYYARWSQMLNRATHSRWSGTAVTTRWLRFSNFRSWMDSQKWENRELDKDLISLGNTIYSPWNCLFISHYANKLLPNKLLRRIPDSSGRLPGTYPLKSGNWRALGGSSCEIRSPVHFKTSAEASSFFSRQKARHIRSLFPKFEGEDPRLIPALERACLFLETPVNI